MATVVFDSGQRLRNVIGTPIVAIMVVALPPRPRASLLTIVTDRQEVRLMYAATAVGAPLQHTIARLR